MKRHLERLPIIRELVRIQHALSTANNLARDRVRADAEVFVQNLLQTERYADARRLNRYEAQVFSQHGEDGIIAEVFRRIGFRDRFFVEIGVQDGLETNTTYLLSQGWKGVWVDADEQKLAAARRHFRRPIEEGRLTIVQSLVTAENVRDVLQRAGVPREFDLLSVDIDRNTYYIWEALQELRPRAVVTEYNASIPPEQEWKVEYASDKVWNGSLYYGASLKSFEQLGADHGYALVGCVLAGVNAFFVRADLTGEQFLRPFTAENHYEPPRYWLRWWRSAWPRGFGDS